LNLLAAILFVIIHAWMTRMFHLDGFSDACDAFSAVTDSQEKRLEIMKDPHPGAVAVCASFLLLLTKTILIFLILKKCSGELVEGIKPFLLHAIPALIAIPVFGRFAVTSLAFIGTYPRKEGTGKTIIENTATGSVILGLITIMPLALFVSIAAMLGALLFAILTVYYWKHKSDRLLGGVTGDILGACCETAECTAALALLLLMK
jgi:adenosylcobinamide-GDP ribazoletransferase